MTSGMIKSWCRQMHNAIDRTGWHPEGDLLVWYALPAWTPQTGLCKALHPYLHGIHTSALLLIAALALHLPRSFSESLWLGYEQSINKSDDGHSAVCCLTQHLSMLTSADVYLLQNCANASKMAKGACTHELHMFGTAIRAEQEGKGHLMGRVLPFQCIVPL